MRSLLEIMVDDPSDENLTEEVALAPRGSDEYFRNGGEGIPFERVVADLGFTMEQIEGPARQPARTVTPNYSRSIVQGLNNLTASSRSTTLQPVRKNAVALMDTFGKTERGIAINERNLYRKTPSAF